MAVAGLVQRAAGNSQADFPSKKEGPVGFSTLLNGNSSPAAAAWGAFTPLQSVWVEKKGEKWEIAHNVTIKTKSRDWLIISGLSKQTHLPIKTLVQINWCCCH